MLEELWRRHKYEGDIHAREELVMKCLPLVKSLAQQLVMYAPLCCDADDLVSAGIIGLLDALEKYDPAEQASFRTYAKSRIRGAMLDEIRNLRWIPRSIQEKIRDLRKVHTRLEQVLSRPPTEEELSDAMGMELDRFRKMLVRMGPSIFLASLWYSEDDKMTQYETSIEDPNAVNPLAQIISEETESILADTIGSLPEKEAIVVSLHYYEDMTIREIGEILSLTESRVYQIHARAILKLFRALRQKISAR